MFRRYKKDEGAPNRLRDEVEPNTLTWTSADGTDAASAEPEDVEDEYDRAQGGRVERRAHSHRDALV